MHSIIQEIPNTQISMKQKSDINILIADTHPIFLMGLKNLFSETDDIKVKALVDNDKDLLKQINDSAVDLILLDTLLPNQNCLDILKKIKTERPKLPILVLSEKSEDQLGVRLIKAGASGYLTKEASGEKILDAVRKVAQGGNFVSQSILEKLAFDFSASYKNLHESLSDREYQVLCLIGKGIPLVEIGNRLNLSVKTISTYRTRILEKMQMKKNSELIYYAFNHDLI